MAALATTFIIVMLDTFHNISHVCVCAKYINILPIELNMFKWNIYIYLFIINCVHVSRRLFTHLNLTNSLTIHDKCSVRERDESSYAICLSHESRVKHYRIDILPSGNFAIQDGPKFESIIAVSFPHIHFILI